VSISGTSEKSISGISGTSISPPRLTPGALVDTFGAEMPIPLPAGILTEIPPNLLKLAVASPFGTETFGAESPAEADASTSFDFFFDFFSF